MVLDRSRSAQHNKLRDVLVYVHLPVEIRPQPADNAIAVTGASAGGRKSTWAFNRDGSCWLTLGMMNFARKWRTTTRTAICLYNSSHDCALEINPRLSLLLQSHLPLSSTPPWMWRLMPQRSLLDSACALGQRRNRGSFCLSLDRGDSLGFKNTLSDIAIRPSCRLSREPRILYDSPPMLPLDQLASLPLLGVHTSCRIT